MKRCSPITRGLAPLCIALTTQAQAQGVPTTGPAALYQMRAQLEAITDCLASEGDSLSLCLCLVKRDDSLSARQRVAEIQRCFDEQEASE